MSQGKLPELEPSALRDHATSDRVERIWRRLESDLPSTRRRTRTALWWAPATLVIVFGTGVFVGARWAGSPTPGAATPLAAEPRSVEEPAAGPETPATGAPELAPTGQRPVTQPSPTQRPNVPSPEPTSSGAELTLVETPPPPTAVLPPAGPPEWQRLGQEGDWTGAWRALAQQGGFDSVLGQANAEQLMLLGDIARTNRQRARAIAAFRRVVERFPGDPNAPLAAWTLANMLESQGDRAGAAKAYAAYRALSPKGDFAEDALARQVEAAVARGDVDESRRLAEEYEQKFPNGRRLREIRARVAKLTGEEPAAEGDAGAAPTDEDKPSSEPEEDESPAAPTP